MRVNLSKKRRAHRVRLRTLLETIKVEDEQTKIIPPSRDQCGIENQRSAHNGIPSSSLHIWWRWSGWWKMCCYVDESCSSSLSIAALLVICYLNKEETMLLIYSNNGTQDICTFCASLTIPHVILSGSLSIESVVSNCHVYVL